MEKLPLIRFRIDSTSGVPIYRQLIDQVRQAVRLGLLVEGDQLPTVREVVQQVAVNPNTVHRSYRELEHQGVVVGRQGQGTFVTGSPDRSAVEVHHALGAEIDRWMDAARSAGMSAAEIEEMVQGAMGKAAKAAKAAIDGEDGGKVR